MTTSKLKYCSLNDYGGRGSVSGFLNDYGFEYVSDVDFADIIVFNGGEDIGTELYAERPVMRSIPQYASRRDEFEKNVFNTHQGKFFLGICRGSQYLNVLNGGTLWQHVDNHTRNHFMNDVETGERIMVTSTHHQMMRPNLLTGKVIATAHEATEKMAYEIIAKVGSPKFDADTEVVWYSNTRTLCIQGHPEYVPGSKFADYSIGLINKYFDEKAVA